MSISPSPPLTAVFFVDPSPLAAASLHAWLAAGHRIAAVVVYQRDGERSRHLQRDRRAAWLVPRWSVSGAVRRHRLPMIVLGPPLDWTALAARMTALAADVLISIGFPRLVPAATTAAFRCGGLNLHPSMLPAYRGPFPFHAIVRDRAAGRHGGMTLHRMADAFDTGDIVAQEAAGESAYTERHQFRFGRLAARLVTREIPRYCAGEIAPSVQQDTAGQPQASIAEGPHRLEPDADIHRLRTLCVPYLPSPGITVATDRGDLPIFGLWRVLGRPSGAPPNITRLAVEMDLLDARVFLWRDTRLARKWHALQGQWQLLRRGLDNRRGI